ncbi:MAG: hypothetical protein P4L69_23810 [Desulfosporosinus sp.]|nr:hypothetical protein [Desulfosporosinus sp.]
MKKIISIILLSAILLIGNIALVQESSLANVKTKHTQTLADYKAAIAPLQEKIRTNRTDVLSQKAIVSAAYTKAKAHIKELSKNKDSLTPTQIEAIKESLNVIKQDKESLASTIGEIQKETLDLRTAKREKNFEEVSNSFNNIITVQNTRIEDLKKIIDDLNKAVAL